MEINIVTTSPNEPICNWYINIILTETCIDNLSVLVFVANYEHVVTIIQSNSVNYN